MKTLTNLTTTKNVTEVVLSQETKDYCEKNDVKIQANPLQREKINKWRAIYISPPAPSEFNCNKFLAICRIIYGADIFINKIPVLKVILLIALFL